MQILNGSNISYLARPFRCYYNVDPVTATPALKGEFMMKPFSNRIAAVRVSGGVWFPQIAFDKWDFCTFSAQKLTKGSSLFAINKLDKIGQNVPIIAKICFQVKEIVPNTG